MSKFQTFIGWCCETKPRICLSAAVVIVIAVSVSLLAISCDWDEVAKELDGPSLEEQMDIYGRAPYVLRGYARAGCLIGKYDFARNVLAEIVRRYPRDTASLKLLITLNIHSSPRDITIQWAEMFIQVDSTNFDVLCDFGHLYYGVGDYDSALSWYERAYEVDSTNLRSICGVAETNDVLGNHSEEWSERCNKAWGNLQLRPAIIDPLERHIQIGPIDEQGRIGKSLYICAPVHSEKRTGPWIVEQEDPSFCSPFSRSEQYKLSAEKREMFFTNELFKRTNMEGRADYYWF